ncbi:SDR family NAD(P)-dependent oxidoreductase [Pseudohongiella sp. SYSU M77423]|uniref:SDR family NAD(P)-dependent oxidoreductase n=1 Tax=Pseudohongiella sp. SYSU M77423 TaxID=3042312 RepID=UPI0024803752|nr:SDR family NAD(P)-dependent oxidoreductase [Pseudohongiella sp. SYSU M77423]MDH7942563.1 SDR family NAD(P)-dependent oxidoreductase [Pseudohongiella sp. SYSU M77423]
MSNRLAVITGATSGIGAAYARAFARQGYKLLLTGRREPELQGLAERLRTEYGITVSLQLGDLSNTQDRQALVETIEALPELDALVNNAGYAEDGRLGEVAWDKHQALIDVHVVATTQLSHAALPKLLKSKGMLINVASVASWIPTGQSVLYGPTKAYVRSFTESVGLAYRRDGLKALAICPGFTITDFHSRMGIDPDRFYKKKGFTRAWTADQVVARSFQDIEKGKLISIQGWNYRLLVFLMRHLPMSWMMAALGRSESARFSK